MSERRNKIVQWLLNNGRGIVTFSEMYPLKETTEKEQAEHPFGVVRYVLSALVNIFENEMPFPEQVSKKLEFLFRLEQLHDQFCPEFEPDWNDHDTPKIAVHFVLILKNLFMRFILIASKQLIKWQRY